MNQNLSHSSGAQITAKHFRKTGSSARIDRIILGLKINIKNTLQHFLKYEVEKFYREAQLAERLVPRLKSTIEGLSDQKLPTRDLGKLFMVMYLKRCE